jgi:hypothetical protein
MGDEFTLCYCVPGDSPAYDFPRHSLAEAASIIGIARRTGHYHQADVWVSCQHCNIGPIKNGPYCDHCWDHVIRVPWVPDCTTCNDTGWEFSRTTHARSITW